jgi:hypothetical protein
VASQRPTRFISEHRFNAERAPHQVPARFIVNRWFRRETDAIDVARADITDFARIGAWHARC